MATRRPRRRRTEVEEIEDIDDEDTVAEDEDIDDEDEDIDDEDEDIDDEDDLEDDEDDEPEPPKRTRRAAKAKTTAKAPVVEDEDKPEPRTRRSRKTEEAKAAMAEADGAFFAGIVDALNAGKALVVSKMENGRIVVTTQDAVQATKPKVRRALSDEYTEFKDEWGNMDYAAKVKKAKKLGVKWAPHDNESVDNMRLMMAVQKHLGISKYA